MKLAVIVMAAGASKRFGAPNKLLQPLHGKPLLQYTLDLAKKIPAQKRVAVCSTDTAAIAGTEGFTVVVNQHPEEGQSSSMRLGIALCRECEGAIFLTGDQPFVSIESILKLIAAFEEHPNYIIGCAINGHFCIPSIFPALVFEELLHQQGDVGGREVMRAHSKEIALVEIDPTEHFDIDTPEDLSKAASYLHNAN